MALELLRCGAVLAAPAGAALACCLVAAAVALRCWAARGLRRALNKTSRQQEVVENLGQAVRALRRQNPEVDVETVLALPLAQLAQKLKNKELSPEAVLYSYLGKAWEVTKETNCITNYLGDCKAQLQELAQHHGEGGLLYGVPISIKECFLYKGQVSTLGLRRNMDFPATEDSVVVRVLKKQGAIPFAHTNVPQSMFSYDCSNPIFGRTLNPLNTSKSPGGSSGGEGALIAGGGSILGLGTDIGGSIRFPAAFCGICGLKPTSNRISKRGLKNSVNGQLAFTTSVGPMARDVDSLALCLRALLCDYMFCLDSTIPPVPFREEIYASKKPLRIGYYESDMFTMPGPSMKRAVLEMKVLLEAAGHTLVPFTPANIPRAVQTVMVSGLFSDGGQALLENFKGDTVDPCLGDLTTILKMPNWFKRLISLLIRPLFPRLAVFLQSLKSKSAGELWDIQHKIEEYRYSVITQWKRQHLDVVLAPMLSPALCINCPGKTSGAVSYTVLYNCLDFPAGVVPVTTVTLEDEIALEQYQGYFGDIWDQMLQKGLKNSVGMPVAVQCVALPWQEELCLRFMREVERVSQEARMLTSKPLGLSEG
ncbi:fatty-acid amide hydrolase 1-like [Gracilinanus agilis]|uniref:fatty-acid amide hydrolase 1-like n=1 Tax=Gracilinanus agilis TaxID=191870 RepID=UPI001CFE8BF7|nr:fatty-acid amide hydrolase 1-like [Gracilinanus agilis]